MWIRILLAGCTTFAATQLAPAQSVLSPASINPYSRTALSPYLNFARDNYDFRNPLLRPIVIAPEYLADYDPTRPFSGRADFGYPSQGYEAWIKARESETRMSPSGQPIGFMIWGPYYDLTNQNSFVPTAPGRGRLYR